MFPQVLKLCAPLALLFVAVCSFAQAIPAPANPVVFCGVQANPAADSYQLSFDGGAMEPLTMDATKHTSCPASSTHSFSLPAARFTVGGHSVRVRGVNQFGSTDGPTYNVTVGIAPGQFTINTVITP